MRRSRPQAARTDPIRIIAGHSHAAASKPALRPHDLEIQRGGTGVSERDIAAELLRQLVLNELQPFGCIFDLPNGGRGRGLALFAEVVNPLAEIIDRLAGRLGRVGNLANGASDAGDRFVDLLRASLSAAGSADIGILISWAIPKALRHDRPRGTAGGTDSAHYRTQRSRKGTCCCEFSGARLSVFLRTGDLWESS